jgi:hypothetical protein
VRVTTGGGAPLYTAPDLKPNIDDNIGRQLRVVYCIALAAECYRFAVRQQIVESLGTGHTCSHGVRRLR